MPDGNKTYAFSDYETVLSLSNAIDDFCAKHNCQPISVSMTAYELFGQKFAALVVVQSLQEGK